MRKLDTINTFKKFYCEGEMGNMSIARRSYGKRGFIFVLFIF